MSRSLGCQKHRGAWPVTYQRPNPSQHGSELTVLQPCCDNPCKQPEQLREARLFLYATGNLARFESMMPMNTYAPTKHRPNLKFRSFLGSIASYVTVLDSAFGIPELGNMCGRALRRTWPSHMHAIIKTLSLSDGGHVYHV